MRKISLTVLTLVIFISFTSAQTLEQKQEELKEAQAILDAQKANVAAIQIQVNDLLPKKIWNKGGAASLNFNSLGLTNWAAGGVSSNSLSSAVNLRANYKKDDIFWANNLDLSYGLIQNEGMPLRKNEDRIDLTSVFGKRISDKFNYAARVNFLSQFAPGFDFTNPEIDDKDRAVISRFMAPAFLNASIGIDYHLTEHLSIFASPLSGKFTFVMDDSIADANIYIPATTDAQGIQFYNNNFRPELGAMLNFMYQRDLWKRYNIKSNLNLFNNFTDVNAANRKNIDVVWITELNIKVTEYIGMRLFTHLIYDNDIALTRFNENKEAIGEGPGTQFMRMFGIGFSKNF